MRCPSGCLTPRLDHELKCIVESFIRHAEGQFNGQEATAMQSEY